MDKKLKSMFEFQRFQNNPRLAKIIAETEQRYAGEISDEDLDLVAAAGVNPFENAEDEDK